jgi:hypothetical protein
MKRFLSGGPKKGDQRRNPEPVADDAEEKDGGFPMTDGYLMIFGGTAAYDSKRCQKLTRHEVYMAETATPFFRRWLRSPITFDWSNHPKSVSSLGRYSLVVNLIVDMKRLTKVLMDGGCGLNIMYIETLDAMGINRSHIRPTRAPFHGIMLGKQAKQLGQIDLPIIFEDPTNYRTETLTFEVVGFHETYHAILGRPCYVKFMVVPNYTYLKLKMSGPHRVITVGTSFQRAYECEVECCEHAMVIIASEEPTVIKEGAVEEEPDSKRSARSFEPRRAPRRSS